MTQLEVIYEMPKEVLTAWPILVAAKYSTDCSEVMFRYGNKMFGGIGRPALTSPHEAWVFVTPEFRPIDIRGLRLGIRMGANRFGYVRAKTEVGNKVQARFAFANGFMFEETVGIYNYFSVRA